MTSKVHRALLQTALERITEAERAVRSLGPVYSEEESQALLEIGLSKRLIQIAIGRMRLTDEGRGSLSPDDSKSDGPADRGSGGRVDSK